MDYRLQWTKLVATFVKFRRIKRTFAVSTWADNQLVRVSQRLRLNIARGRKAGWKARSPLLHTRHGEEAREREFYSGGCSLQRGCAGAIS